MTMTSRQQSFGFAAIIGVALSSWCLAQKDNEEKSKPKAVVPPPKITISKETTWATEPLRPDGFVDFLEAVNLRHSKDVTVENNACVLLYQAMGPSPQGDRMPDRFFRRMGIEPLPDEGPYFENWNGDGGLPDAVEKPWTARKHPDVAAWLKRNELPLATTTAATERPRYFSPLVSTDAKPDGGMIEVMLPGAQRSRDLSRALAARAMWEVAEGSQVDAWRDLMAMHRLGRLVGQGPTVIEYLFGIAIECRAIDFELQFLSQTEPSAKMLKLYRKQLDRLPPRALVADKLDVGERASVLDCAHRMARGQMDLKEIADARENNPLFEKLTEGPTLQMVDWDVVLKSANQWFDRLEEISRKPSYLERTAAMQTLEEEVKKLVEQRRGPMALLPLLGGKPAITQAMSETLISLLLPSVTQVYRAEGSAIQRMHNLELAFALTAWRNEHDSYPESLGMLAPKYIAEIPIDHFNGQPLKYDRLGEGYRFYSVGRNEKDDEGRTFDEGADDLVVRMPAK